MTECPSCGRFTGPYPACPYCGARLKGRTPLRWLKVVALVLSTAGLAGLWFAATRAHIPRVPIGQLGGTMNMAYVRVEGHVTRGPEYDPSTEALSFWLADDTGELRVSAYRNEARDLIAQQRIPSVGDQVSVAGTLRIREDFLALYLNAPDQLQITRPEPAPLSIGQIGPLDVGRRVRVAGQVRQIYQPYEGLTLITLRDESGEIAVAVGEALVLLSGPLPAIAPGQTLEVTAAVSLYKDTPQLVPASTADLRPAPGEVSFAPLCAIGSLASSDTGRWVQVEGEVVETAPFSSGVRFTLDDGSGQIALLLWQNLYATVPNSDTADAGARVRVQGTVAEYQGALEIVPDAAGDVVVLVAAPAAEVARVGDLGPHDAGRLVRLEGVLGPAEAFSKGVRFPLDDGTGEITLLLWSNVAGQAPAGLGPGVRVRVTGQVQEYKGNLEIVPRWAHDVEIPR